VILDYTDRVRTLEEVAKLLNVSLEIKMQKGKRGMWQVKLEKLAFKPPNNIFARDDNKNPYHIDYVFSRSSNPNSALTLLAKKLSNAIVDTPDNRRIRLGEVIRGGLYVRLHE